MLGCERLKEKYVPQNLQFRSSSFKNIRNRIHYFPGLRFLSAKFASNEQLSNMDDQKQKKCARFLGNRKKLEKVGMFRRDF